MPPASPQTRRWTHWLGGVGWGVFVAFPWLWAFVSESGLYERSWWVPIAAGLNVIALAYIAIFLTILVHESGHWICGRLVGIRIREFVVGTGSSALRFKWRNIQFTFGPWLRWGYVREVPSRANLVFGKRLVFLSGGVLAEIIFLLILLFASPDLGLFFSAFDSLRHFIFVAGALGIWVSVLPQMVSIEGRRTPNDALLIVQAWKNRGNEDAAWQRIERAEVANALIRAKKYAEAAEIIEHMLESDPRNAALRSSLATLYAATSAWDRAFHAYQTIIDQTAPDSAEHVHAVDGAASLALQIGRRQELERLRPLVERAATFSRFATIIGTHGSILIELGEIETGVKLLNQCVAGTTASHDRAVANAYLAKAALLTRRPKRAGELLAFAKKEGGDHPLVKRLVAELEPQLERTDESRPTIS